MNLAHLVKLRRIIGDQLFQFAKLQRHSIGWVFVVKFLTHDVDHSGAGRQKQSDNVGQPGHYNARMLLLLRFALRLIELGVEHTDKGDLKYKRDRNQYKTVVRQLEIGERQIEFRLHGSVTGHRLLTIVLATFLSYVNQGLRLVDCWFFPPLS